MTKVVLSENQKAASEVAGKVAKVKFSNTADKLDMYLPEENSFNVSLPGKEVESHFTEILRLDEQDFEDIQTAMVNLRSYLSDLSSSGNNQKLHTRAFSMEQLPKMLLRRLNVQGSCYQSHLING